MPDGQEPISVRVIESLSGVVAAQWDACAGSWNPFVSYAFLSALEESGSVGERSGWYPRHLAVFDDTGTLAGAVPAYIKTHSQGEYVFDWGWADAYERAGGRYYPKLQVAVPFSPVTGPRLLVRPGAEAERTRQALIAGLMEATARFELSSAHVTFPTAADADVLEAAGFLIRHGHQFHWHNDGYATFDDFLASLSSRKRKNIRKERARVGEAGVDVRVITGDALAPRHWDAFYRFYTSTYDRKWGYPYLTRTFFDLLGERMADNVALVMAEADGRPIAGALNLVGSEAIFGRNWGCVARYDFLHFEACYYQAIQFAIDRGLQRVEAGTQGPHKLQRGYMPVRTYSAHFIRDRGFRDAVADYLRRERQAEAGEIAHLAGLSPFKRTDG